MLLFYPERQSQMIQLWALFTALDCIHYSEHLLDQALQKWRFGEVEDAALSFWHL